MCCKLSFSKSCLHICILPLTMYTACQWVRVVGSVGAIVCLGWEYRLLFKCFFIVSISIF